MARTTVLQLPQELIDKIVDEFWQQPSMLIRLSCVSTKFLPRTRLILFHEVHLRGPRGRELSKIISHPLSRDNVLRSAKIVVLDPGLDASGYNPIWLLSVLKVLHFAVNARDLRLRQVDFRLLFSGDNMAGIPTTTFQYLRILTLEGVHLGRWSHLASCILSCGSLQELHLLFLAVDEEIQDALTLPPCDIAGLPVLKVDGRATRFIMIWMQPFNLSNEDSCQTSTEELAVFGAVDLSHVVTAPDLDAFLLFMGERVHKLALDLSHCFDHTSVSTNTGLRRLRLYYGGLDMPLNADGKDLVAALLGTINAAPELRKIVLRLNVDTFDLKWMKWDDIVAALCRQELAAVQCVRVEINSPWMLNFVRAKLNVLFGHQKTPQVVRVDF